MATAPTWDKGVGRHSLSNFDRYAKFLTERGIANDDFRADVAKMGGLDNYRKALVDHEKGYIKYQIDFAKENGYLEDLAGAYQKAIDSGFFSSSEVNTFKKQANKLAPQIAEAKRQREAEQLAKDQRRARIDAADPVFQNLNSQFQAQNTALRQQIEAQREAAFNDVRNSYREDVNRINELLSSGQITKEQRNVAWDQAQANEEKSIKEIKANYTAASKQVSDIYDKNIQNADAIREGIISGKQSANQQYSIIAPPKNFAVKPSTYQAAPITAVENLPEPEPDPYAGMTMEEERAAKKAAAQARMDEVFSQPQKEVTTKSFEEMFADVNASAAADQQARAAQYYDGPAGITLNQSEEIAKVLAANLNIGSINIDGEIADNPVENLRNRIFNEGYQSVLDDLLEQGGVAPVPQNYIDRTVAEDFAKDMLSFGGFNLTNLASWANTVQAVGFEEAAKRFGEANPSTAFNILGSDFNIGRIATTSKLDEYKNRNDQAIQNLRNTSAERIDDSILRVMAGLPALPNVPEGMSAQEALDGVLELGNFSYTPETYDGLLDYFEKWGPDTGIAYLELIYNPTGTPTRNLDLVERRDEPFGTTSPIEPLLNREEPTLGTTGAPQLPGQSTELGVPVERGEVTPAAGLSAIAPAYPTTLPTTGVPTSGVPAGFQASTYQPAPYTPPPLLAQAPDRPTLTPTQELIGAPGIDRGVPVPMQALTPEQVGSRFTPPTQEDYYAFFGYTPEQLNAAQYLAELEGAPRAGIAAQTVPTLPPAVTGAPTEMKEGGMPQDAQRLANQGRNGDSMLVHMTPKEVAGLQSLARQMGGSLTINPETGLPEANFFKDKLLPIATTLIAASFGVPIPVGAMLYGAGTAIGSGSVEKGIAAGLTAYGGANLASSAYTGMTGGTLPGFEAAGAEAAKTGFGAEFGGELLPKMGDADFIISPENTLLNNTISKLSGPATVATDLNSVYLKGVLPMTTGMGLQEGIEQREEYQNYMDKVAADNEKRRRESQQLFESTLGSVPLQYARKGGLMRLAGGGMTYAEGGGTTDVTNEPRMVKGTGDGMSDSVPATIEGVQEARLANDEFVVPADVVADLGNGSSSAGAQQLYDMMDRVRQARHGTTEQPPEIDVQKLMPA